MLKGDIYIFLFLLFSACNNKQPKPFLIWKEPVTGMEFVEGWGRFAFAMAAGAVGFIQIHRSMDPGQDGLEGQLGCIVDHRIAVLFHSAGHRVTALAGVDGEVGVR